MHSIPAVMVQGFLGQPQAGWVRHVWVEVSQSCGAFPAGPTGMGGEVGLEQGAAEWLEHMLLHRSIFVFLFLHYGGQLSTRP